MTRDRRVSGLLGRWEMLRETGYEPSAEELCRDCPELTATVRRMLDVLQAFDPLETRETPFESSSHPTAADTDMARPTGPVAGPDGYRIVRELGRGGMGVVYEAVQTSLNRPVALKMILAGAHVGQVERERFRQEAEAVARLQHPNIVQVFEVGAANGLPFCVLEYVPGGTLAEAIRERPFFPAEAADFCRLLADAVEAAHRAGVIHRDLKPSNILMTGVRGEEFSSGMTKPSLGSIRPNVSNPLAPKITDFGLAKLLDPPADGDCRPKTLSGSILGTPSYMAPEQALGEASVGPAADTYAVGAILYEMLTGRPPFLAATVFETLALVTHSEPVPPRRLNRSVPRDLETVCQKCLEKDPQRRYATARDLAEDLGRFLAGLPVLARPVGPPTHAWRWCRRNPGVSAALTALAVVLIAATAVSTLAAVRARESATLATKRKSEADANYLRARRTVDDLFVAVSDGRLKTLPGGQPFRKELLRLALNYYLEFLAERADDPSNREAIASTYTKVGMIVGEVETALSATQWLEKAVAEWRSLVAADPGRADYRRELAGALDRYGLHLNRAGRLPDALLRQEEAVVLLDALHTANPDEREHASYLSRALTNLSVTQGKLGRNADAVRTGEQGLTLDEELIRRQPSDLVHRRSVGARSMNLGLDLAELDRVEDAIRSLERSCRVYEELCAEIDAHPDRAAALGDAISNPRGGLAQAELNLGLILVGDEQFVEGRRRLVSAATRARAISVANPTVRLYRELELAAESNAVLAGLEIGVAPTELLPGADRACAVGDRLVVDDGSNPDYRARLGLAHAARGAVLARLGKGSEAQEAWHTAEGCFPQDAGVSATLRFLRNASLYFRAVGRVSLMDAAAAARDAQTYLDGTSTPIPGIRVAVARLFARCAEISTGAERTGYEDRAIDQLRLAVRTGYRKADRLLLNPQFASLHGRAEFGEIIRSQSLSKQ